MSRIQYAPPPLNRDELCERMSQRYPHHVVRGEDLIRLLVDAYIDLWHLKRQFDDRRVVATGCILAVQEVHSVERVRYLHSCVEYFGRFVHSRELAWGGVPDVRGAHDTVMVYKERFKRLPPEPWNELVHAHDLKKPALTLVH